MSLQRLGGFDLAATTDTLLYTCPTNFHALVCVNFVTRSASRTVRLALTASSTPADTDYLEYEFPLSVGGGPLYRSGIAMAAGNRLYGRASGTGVSVVLWGNAERLGQ